jgi:predicted ribonuclease YlaK
VQTIVDQLRQRLCGIAENYNRLVLLVGPAGSGKTSALRALAVLEKSAFVNVGVAVTERLLDLTERQQVLQLPRILEDSLAKYPNELNLLDNIEILFNPRLRQDPIRLLQGLSRQRTIVASWPGEVHGGYLTYGSPEHPEFRRHEATDLSIVCLGGSV